MKNNLVQLKRSKIWMFLSITQFTTVPLILQQTFKFVNGTTSDPDLEIFTGCTSY